VNTPYQRKGMGSKLLGTLLELAKAESVQEMILRVLDKNFKAIRLYERWGFKKIGKTVENVKGRVHHVFIMKKTL
jgi:L-amino acid N-acyltransferase YncA